MEDVEDAVPLIVILNEFYYTEEYTYKEMYLYKIQKLVIRQDWQQDMSSIGCEMKQ